MVSPKQQSYNKITQVTPVIISVLAMLMVGTLGYLGHKSLAQLETIQTIQLKKLSLLTRISNDIADHHIRIYKHLRSAQGTIDEGEFYDKGKPLLLNMHLFEERMQVFINNQPQNSELNIPLKNISERLTSYRINTTNAILLAAADLTRADDLLNQSTGYYAQLNKNFLNINQIIQKRLNHEASIYHEEFIQTSLVAASFIICLILVSVFISRLLAQRFNNKLLELESLVSLNKNMQERSITATSEISILSSAIDNVENNYKFLENSRQHEEQYAKALAVEVLEKKKFIKELATKNTELKTEVAERKKIQILLDKMAMYDQLTMLPNRVLLKREADKILAAAKRNEHKVYFLFIDLDGFKAVNDNNGHDIGDAVLVEASQRLTKSVREIDTVGRFGGDEFLVIMPDCQSTSDIQIITNRILNTIKHPFKTVTIKETLSASIGVALYPDDATTFENLISIADKTMYQAKRAGGNRYTNTSKAH